VLELPVGEGIKQFDASGGVDRFQVVTAAIRMNNLRRKRLIFDGRMVLAPTSQYRRLLGKLQYLSKECSRNVISFIFAHTHLACVYGGESGIRTHGTLRYTRFPSVRLKPLGHLSRSGNPARFAVPL
jgi:hypothetical protein